MVLERGHAALAQPRGAAAAEHRDLRSAAPVATGDGVDMDAVGEQLDEPEDAIEIYSRRSVAHGAGEWTVVDVSAPADLRLYRATATEQWIGRRDRRQAL
jgi:hypothetical protein